jgi:morphogenetic protein associated with SpoVID
MEMPYSPEGLPVGTGGLADYGCGPAPILMPAAEAMPSAMPPVMPNIVPNQVPNPVPNPVQQTFVPPTPPIYSAPYTGTVNVAQPPFMNPYGMVPEGAYGMPRYIDESND